MCNVIFYIIGIIFVIIPIILIIVSLIFWPSNIFIEEIIKQLDLYYNSSIIMDISTNCDNKSNNILGSFWRNSRRKNIFRKTTKKLYF